MQGAVTLAIALAGLVVATLSFVFNELREHRRGRDLKAVLHFRFVKQAMLQVEVEIRNRTLDPAEIAEWRVDVRYMTQDETFWRSLFPRARLESFRSSQPPDGTTGPTPEVPLEGLHSLSWRIPVPAGVARTLVTVRAALRTGEGKWVYSQRLTAPRAGYLPRWVVLSTWYVYAARLLRRPHTQ
jgi:hypothetical protein